jgi:HK97 family phage major capsid protein
VAPQEFIAELVRAVHDESVVESVARTFNITKAQSLGAPSLDTTLNDADWTTEVATIAEDTALKTGKRELNPTKLSKLVKLSQTLMRQAAVDPEGLVREEMAYKFSITKDKAFLTGSGSNQPLGVFTPSAQGISTGRDVACANATKVIGDDFIKAKMTMKAQYQGRPTTKWCLHRDVLQSLMLEKASTAGTYMFMPGLSAQTPDTILAIPYMLSENAPNTLTSRQVRLHHRGLALLLDRECHGLRGPGAQRAVRPQRLHRLYRQALV